MRIQRKMNSRVLHARDQVVWMVLRILVMSRVTIFAVLITVSFVRAVALSLMEAGSGGGVKVIRRSSILTPAWLSRIVGVMLVVNDALVVFMRLSSAPCMGNRFGFLRGWWRLGSGLPFPFCSCFIEK